MAESSTLPEPALGNPGLPQAVSIGRWFAFYGVFFLALAIPLAVLIQHNPEPFRQIWAGFVRFFTTFKWPGFLDALRHTDPATKLLFMAIYLSLATTFLPLPTSFVVTLVALKGAGISESFLPTVLIVSFVGAASTTIANLNDYHIFLWLLRSKGIARIRDTKTYHVAAKWFATSPFLIMLVFNIFPIPIDVPRMLAAIYGYPRVPFALANFIGRFIRYAIFASVTFLLGEKGWIAVVATLGIAVALGLWKLGPALRRRLAARRAAA